MQQEKECRDYRLPTTLETSSVFQDLPKRKHAAGIAPLPYPYKGVVPGLADSVRFVVFPIRKDHLTSDKEKNLDVLVCLGLPTSLLSPPPDKNDRADSTFVLRGTVACPFTPVPLSRTFAGRAWRCRQLRLLLQSRGGEDSPPYKRTATGFKNTRELPPLRLKEVHFPIRMKKQSQRLE